MLQLPATMHHATDTFKYLKTYQYASALRALAKASQKGKEAIMAVALEFAKKEVRSTYIIVL